MCWYANAAVQGAFELVQTWIAKAFVGGQKTITVEQPICFL